MPEIKKTRSGMLLYEDFSTNSLIWNPSPNDYLNIEFGDFGLRIIHSDKYRMITINEPSQNYNFQCKLTHSPVNAGDIGGVIVIGNVEEYVECQSRILDKPSTITNETQTEAIIKQYITEAMEEYVQYDIEGEGTSSDGTTDPPSGDPSTPIPTETYVDTSYPYMKVIKYNGVYTFLASTNGVQWEEIGNAKLEANRIGFFLHADEAITEETKITSELSHFVVDYATFYDNNFITFDGFLTNQQIDIFSNGVRICSSESACTKKGIGRIIIDTTNLNLPIRNSVLRLIESDGTGKDYQIGDLIGGDIIALSINLGLYINGVEINQFETYNLGTFYNHSQTMKLDLYNKEDQALSNIKITITAFSVYHGGEENILISLYDDAQTTYNFQKEIIIDSISSMDSRSFLVKLSDKIMQDFYKVAGTYRFKINIIQC